MSTALRSLLVIIFGILGCCDVSAQEEKFFNSYVLRAYEVMRKNQAAKYDKASYFTKNLDYGDEKGAIRARNAPFTMCNAAVTETIIEAINLYD